MILTDVQENFCLWNDFSVREFVRDECLRVFLINLRVPDSNDDSSLIVFWPSKDPVSKWLAEDLWKRNPTKSLVVSTDKVHHYGNEVNFTNFKRIQIFVHLSFDFAQTQEKIFKKIFNNVKRKILIFVE